VGEDGSFVCDSCKPRPQSPDDPYDPVVARRLWGGIMLTSDLNVCRSLLQGKRVPVKKLSAAPLRRCFRGDPSALFQAQERGWIEVTNDMLDAIAEGGPFADKSEG